MKEPATASRALTFVSPHGASSTPEIDRAVFAVISRVSDKWTLIVLETLGQHGVLRFGRLSELVGQISQKMLTKTLRQMEHDGFVTRTVYAVVPPKVEYELTELGFSLGAALCGLWEWAENHYGKLEHLTAVTSQNVQPNSTA